MNIALYIRLSKEDDNDLESRSISNQKLYLNDYINRFNFNQVYEYVDDGYSGTNFDRPGFQKMLKDIEDKKIDTVITKDSSRLGRNISWVTFYIEEYFPSKKVRYIAIDDRYDSYENDSLEAEMLTFKSLFNDYYCKDISRKIKSSLKIKKVEGKFTGWKAPYGYIRKKDDYHELEIDYKVVDVVKRIFALAYEDNTPSAIAKMLNQEKIASPSTYARMSISKWTSKSIRDILQNPTYIGNMAQGKRRKINYKLKKCINLPIEEWIIKENTHEAIINKDVFEEVQKKLKKYHNIKNNKIKNNEIINFMYCRECNSKIGLNYKKNQSYCVCNNYKKNYNLKKCTPHTVNYNRLKILIINELNKDIDEFFLNEKNNIRKIISEKIDLEKTLSKADEYFLRLYIDYKNKKIDKNDYHIIRKNKEREISMLKEKLTAVVNKIRYYIFIQNRKNCFDDKLYIKMIDRIYLSESGEVEIILNYHHEISNHLLVHR